jgi:GLPGLI family protein
MNTFDFDFNYNILKTKIMINRLYILFVMIMVSGFSAVSQIEEGVITYEYRLDVHRNIPPEREDLKAMVPQYRTENYEMFFNKDERFYRSVVDVNELATAGGGGGRRMMFRAPKIEIYTNNQTQEWVGQQEFMGKNYLILDTITLAPWRLGSELMDIAGYRCQMAWYTDTVTNEEITAWFTLSIQPFMGPDRFVSLPGAILAVDINNGEKVWVARKIEVRPLKSGEIKKPVRGEKISRIDFRKMTDEQMERMRAGGRF